VNKVGDKNPNKLLKKKKANEKTKEKSPTLTEIIPAKKVKKQ